MHHDPYAVPVQPAWKAPQLQRSWLWLLRQSLVWDYVAESAAAAGFAPQSPLATQVLAKPSSSDVLLSTRMPHPLLLAVLCTHDLM